MQIDKHSLSGLMLNYCSFLNTKYLTGKMKELWLIEDSICDYQAVGRQGVQLSCSVFLLNFGFLNKMVGKGACRPSYDH